MAATVTVVVNRATHLFVAVRVLVMHTPVVMMAVRGDNHTILAHGCLLLLAQQCECRQRRCLHRQPS